MKTVLTWSVGNTKLAKDNIISINLPAGITCNFAGSCKSICYAKKGRYVFPAVKAAYARNLAQVETLLAGKGNLAEVLAEDIAQWINKGYSIFRIHASGDFYCQEYANAWQSAIRLINNRYPHFATFYAYTKAFNYFDNSKPSNLRIIQSFGSIHDDSIDLRKPHARIFDTLEDMNAAGYIDCSKSDLLALHATKIGLLKH